MRTGSGIPLIGRQHELAVLETALAAAAEGQARAVLLAGDAGVGKTRLLTELCLRANGFTVLTGRCLDVAGLPYLPFVEALGQLPVAGDSRLDGAMEQLRLFEAVHTALAQMPGPVLLALEDLHWADAATRDLLLFLVSRLSRQRLLVVGTYRLDDLHRRHPLRPLLAEVTRLSTVERIELRPFDRADAMAFASALADHDLPEATLRGIAERSQGNAFFCEELTAVYGDGVPSGLSDVLLARVERLGPNARRVVRAASGAGGAVEHSVLQAVTEVDDLDEAVREAVQHNVLVTADHSYAFRHALLGEAVYGDLMPGERARLHARYARLATSPAALAYHSLQSHDLPTAMRASIRAADEAANLRAPAEALHHVEQALQLFDAVPDPGVTEYRLQLMASRMALAAGHAERAVAYARSAVALADDPEDGAKARHQLVLTLLPMERAAETAAAVREAWELIKDRPPSVVQAQILSLRAREWAWYGGPGLELEQLERLAERAAEIGTLVGAEDVAIDAQITLASYLHWRREVEKAEQLLRDAASRAAALGLYAVELRALKNLAFIRYYRCSFREMLTIVDEILDRAVVVGLTWAEIAMEARIARLEVRFMIGERSTAEPFDDRSAAPRSAALRLQAAELYQLAVAGRSDEVEEAATRILAATDNPTTVWRVRLARAEVALWQGNPRVAVDESVRIIDWLAELPSAGVGDSRMAGATALAALADIAAQARRDRDEEAARDAVAEGERLNEKVLTLGNYALEIHRRQQMRHPETVLQEARMNAELSRLRGENDVELWRTAVTSADMIRYRQATARWRLAEALLDKGRRDEAASELEVAHADAVHMGATPLREAIEALARRGRVALAGVEPESEFLTPREHAVLELVSTGLTNRQVGERLYISEKTASVHLSRVMAKLGASSRTEAVSLAYERGLLT